MPAEIRPGAPSASTAPEPVRRSPRQIAPSTREPTKNDVPRPLSMPSGKNPSGRLMRSGKLSGGAAVAGHGARTKARTATNRTTNLRTTNPRLECDPLAEQSLDYLAAHRQLDVPRFGLDRLPGLGHQVPGDRLAAVRFDGDARRPGQRRRPGMERPRATAVVRVKYGRA